MQVWSSTNWLYHPKRVDFLNSVRLTDFFVRRIQAGKKSKSIQKGTVSQGSLIDNRIVHERKISFWSESWLKDSQKGEEKMKLNQIPSSY